jgi:hypothetical protein
MCIDESINIDGNVKCSLLFAAHVVCEQTKFTVVEFLKRLVIGWSKNDSGEVGMYVWNEKAEGHFVNDRAKHVLTLIGSQVLCILDVSACTNSPMT